MLRRRTHYLASWHNKKGRQQRLRTVFGEGRGWTYVGLSCALVRIHGADRPTDNKVLPVSAGKHGYLQFLAPLKGASLFYFRVVVFCEFACLMPLFHGSFVRCLSKGNCFFVREKYRLQSEFGLTRRFRPPIRRQAKVSSREAGV